MENCIFCAEKTENFNSQERGGGGRWLAFNCFFLSFSNHGNYSIKNICLYSKIKKTKVTSKQNIEHFKMIHRRLFIQKFCNNAKMLLLSSWAIFIKALVFSSSPRANFFSFEYLCFLFLLIFRFLYYHKDWEVSIMLYYLFDTAKQCHVLFKFS